MHHTRSLSRRPAAIRRNTSRPGGIPAVFLLAALLATLLGLLAQPVQAQGGGWQFTVGSIVHTAAVSADGQAIVVGSRDGLVIRLDHDGKEVWRYDTKGTVFGLGITADGKRVVAATESRSIFLLDESGKLVWKKDYDYVIQTAAISGDGSLIVLAMPKSKQVVALDKDGNEVWSVKLEVSALTVAITGDGKYVAAGTRDAYIRLFDASGKLVWKQQMAGLIAGVAASQDGAYYAVADESPRGYLLKGQIEAGKKNSTAWEYKLGAKGTSAAITGDGRTVAVGSRDKNIYTFDANGKLLIQYPTGAAVASVALSADGSTLVAGSEDGKAYGFNVKQSAAGYAAQQQTQGVMSVAVPLAIILLIVLIVLFLRFTGPGQRFWARYGRRPSKLARDIWRARVSYLLLFPTVALLLIFNYYPAVSGLFHSFTDWKPGISEEWVGLKNFQSVVNNEFLRIGVVNAIILIVTGYVKTLTMPLLVAELLFHLRSSRTQYWLRSLFIFPIVVPGVAIILVWRNIFDPNIGLVNNVLSLLGLMNMQQPQAWLGDPNTAIWSIVFIGFPFIGAFALLLYYGGLISIPTELFDAAKVDGATAIRRFFSIDLPLLMGQIKLLLILGFIGGMQEFGIVFLTTEGGPYNSTYTPALELYYQAMRFSNFGVASAIGTVLFIVILGGTVLNLRMRSATEYQA